jgi:hypothetical protein
VGDVLRRRQIHDRFGGSHQSGMATAPRIGSVLLFTGDSGKAYGYNFDGPEDDGSFSYTGEGRKGNQQLTRGNAAVLQPGVVSRLFESAGRGKVRYLGEYRPDPTKPYRTERAPSAEGETRNVLVFKLWPATSRPAAQPAEPLVAEIPIESNLTEVFETSPNTEPREAQRRESALVHRYRKWAEAAGGELVRHKIIPPGGTQPLYTDTFDRVTRELVEAKGSTERHYIRQALGQLLDYGRFVEHNSLALLVPSRPADDLVALLAEHGIDCIFEPELGRFERCNTP